MLFLGGSKQRQVASRTSPKEPLPNTAKISYFSPRQCQGPAPYGSTALLAMVVQPTDGGDNPLGVSLAFSWAVEYPGEMFTRVPGC